MRRVKSLLDALWALPVAFGLLATGSLPAGAVVGVKETLEAVDKGLVEGGFDLIWFGILVAVNLQTA